MEIFYSIVIFSFGAIVASFVGVIVARLNTGEGFLVGRSHCDACNMPLNARMLVPIISYITSGGCARCCGARLSLLSPFTELLLGGMFVLSYFKVGLTGAFFCMIISLSMLLALVLYDFKHQILPPPLLALFVAVSAITGFLTAPSLTAFSYSIFIAILIAFFFALVHFFSRGRAMGLADAPLTFGLALIAGPSAFSGFIFSFWIGAVIGILILLKRPYGSRMGVEVPFAPYLAAGFLLAYFTQWNPFTIIADLLL